MNSFVTCRCNLWYEFQVACAQRVHTNRPSPAVGFVDVIRGRVPLADSLPSSLSTPTAPVNPHSDNDRGLSVGATAVVGVGIAIAVILMAIGVWMFVRQRRRRRQRKRKTSGDSRSPSDLSDTENGHGAYGPDMKTYRTPSVPELPNSGRMTGDDKARHELASPVVAQEVHGDREFAAELQRSAVPLKAMEKSETWSPDPLSYDQDNTASSVEKKSGVRLFDDAPIDEEDDSLHNHDHR